MIGIVFVRRPSYGNADIPCPARINRNIPLAPTSDPTYPLSFKDVAHGSIAALLAPQQAAV
jgi:hypothetical protein